MKDSDDKPERWIEQAYLLALSRQPSAGESAASTEFLEGQIRDRTERSPDEPVDEVRRRALADFCQTVFSLNEFLYVD
jgi:hypothetical protein